jgi:hypothetical protein
VQLKLRRLEAAFDLKNPDREQVDSSAVLKRLRALEKKVEDPEKRAPRTLGGSM